MDKKFWELYRKTISPEIVVGLWFVTPVLTLFFTKNPAITIVVGGIVIAATILLENGYNNYMRNK